MSVPHFDLPFRFGFNGHATTVEQDTIEEVSNAVEAIIRTTQGQREELPEFGIPNLTFSPQPLQIQAVIEAVLEQEPRAAVIMEQSPDQFDQLIARVIARVSINDQEVNSA